jgi:hypothetical protein
VLCFCFSSSCVPYVTSFSRLCCVCFSSSCVPYVASFSRLCCVFVFLRLAYPMLPASLGCVLFLFFFVLCTLCCQLLWVVLCFCFSSSCVPYVASFSRLCCVFVFLRLVYPMLPASLGCVVFLFFFVLCTLCYQLL